MELRIDLVNAVSMTVEMERSGKGHGSTLDLCWRTVQDLLRSLVAWKFTLKKIKT